MVIEIVLIVITSCVTFLLGRYTSHLEDYRTGLKNIDNLFYKPFLSLYKNAHHAYALFFVDIDYQAQESMMKFLLDNIEVVPPVLKRRIYDLEQCFSGYSKDIQEGLEISKEDKEYVEESFYYIYNYIESQYTKNERKLYCSIWKRLYYKIQELLIRCNII